MLFDFSNSAFDVYKSGTTTGEGLKNVMIFLNEHFTMDEIDEMIKETDLNGGSVMLAALLLTLSFENTVTYYSVLL